MYFIEEELNDKTLSLRLSGSVQIEDARAFNDEMRKHSKKPKITQIILDLNAVQRMDQAGLGVLVGLSTSMQRYGRRLALARIPAHINNLLRESEIEGFFPTVESEEELKGFISTTPRNSGAQSR